MNLSTFTTTTILLLFTTTSTTTSSSASTVSTTTPSRTTPNTNPQQHPIIMTSPSEQTPTGPLLLSDILPQSKFISIFSEFARSIKDVSRLLAACDTNTTVLAPSNGAIIGLPRKPWEDPDGLENSRSGADHDVFRGQSGDDRASNNLKRFVQAHLVGVAPWTEGAKVKTLEGTEIWWTIDSSGRKVIMPEKIVVDSAAEAANGELWIIDGIVNYDE